MSQETLENLIKQAENITEQLQVIQKQLNENPTDRLLQQHSDLTNALDAVVKLIEQNVSETV